MCREPRHDTLFEPIKVGTPSGATRCACEYEIRYKT